MESFNRTNASRILQYLRILDLTKRNKLFTLPILWSDFKNRFITKAYLDTFKIEYQPFNLGYMIIGTNVPSR